MVAGPNFLSFAILSMVVSGSPKRWDRWHSPSPNWQEKYHLYTTEKVLAFVGGGEKCYRSHLLGEPETTIDNLEISAIQSFGQFFLKQPHLGKILFEKGTFSSFLGSF